MAKPNYSYEKRQKELAKKKKKEEKRLAKLAGKQSPDSESSTEPSDPVPTDTSST